MSETLNLKQLAAELGKHPETTRRYLAKGIIPARRTLGDRGDWIIQRKSVDEYLGKHYDPETGR